MGTPAKLYFSVLNQCNLECNCCFLVQKWKMSYEAVFRGSRRHAWCLTGAPCLSPPPPPTPNLSIWRHFTIFIDPRCLLSYSLRGLGSVYNSYFFWVLFLNIYMCVFRKNPSKYPPMTQEPWQPLWLKKVTGCTKGVGWDGGGVERSLWGHIVFQHDGF